VSDEAPRTADEVALPGGNFQLFVQKLGYQALLSLGVLENPLTKERTVNAEQARMVIDDLHMLRDKTAGNLGEEEERHLEEVIGQLEEQFEKIGSEAG